MASNRKKQEFGEGLTDKMLSNMRRNLTAIGQAYEERIARGDAALRTNRGEAATPQDVADALFGVVNSKGRCDFIGKIDKELERRQSVR